MANWIGATLEKNGASVTWDSKSENEETLNADRLHLRQILLGHTANANEYNVVEVSQTKKTMFGSILGAIFFALCTFNAY